MSRTTAILLTALLVFAVPAGAQKLYKWVDKDGKVSYHDQPPPQGAGYRVEEKRLGPRSPAAAARPGGEPAESFPVVLYVTPQCSSCDAARAYLQKRKVPFTEKNVEDNVALQEELRQKSGGLAVPTILIGEKVMKGYLESLLEGELDAAGYPRAEAGVEG